jgi:hypothetical protein
MTTRRGILWGTAVAAVLAVGCDGRTRSGETQSAANAAPGNEAPAAAPAGPVERAEGEEWAATAAHAASVRVGEVTTVTISATPKEGWHINKEYPTKLQVVSAEGFTTPQDVLRGDAAARNEEVELRFELPLTAGAAGEHAVNLKLKFGLCAGDRCVTREADFTWTFRVEG